MNRLPPAVAAVTVAALAAAAPGQDRAEPRPRPPQEAVAAPAWPSLSAERKARVKNLFRVLRSEKEEVRERAERELEEIGAGAAPLILAKLTDFRVNVNDSLLRVLDRITEPEHAPLLARHISSPKRVTRLWVLRRLAGWHRAELAPLFREACADRDEDVAFRAAVALASTGDLSRLDEVFARCRRRWHEVGAWVAPALTGARGREGSAWLLERIAGGTVREKVTALRLLRSLGDADSAGALRPLLDSEHHDVKKETVNALRVIVDGKPADESLTVFQVINLAKEWKRKL